MLREIIKRMMTFDHRVVERVERAEERHMELKKEICELQRRIDPLKDLLIDMTKQFKRDG